MDSAASTQKSAAIRSEVGHEVHVEGPSPLSTSAKPMNESLCRVLQRTYFSPLYLVTVDVLLPFFERVISEFGHGGSKASPVRVLCT